jgi:hypothetical protein
MFGKQEESFNTFTDINGKVSEVKTIKNTELLTCNILKDKFFKLIELKYICEIIPNSEINVNFT